MLRRSSVFAAEVMEVFDRSPTDKELVSQAKALCRDYINSRLIRAGVSWSKPKHNAPLPGGKLAEVSTILLRLGESCGYAWELKPGGNDSGHTKVSGTDECQETFHVMIQRFFLLCFGHLDLFLMIFPKQLLSLHILSSLEHCSAQCFCRAPFFFFLRT